MTGNELVSLNRRIKELENKVEQLRVGRRVLMRLLEKSEAEKWEIINRLREEKEQLMLRNRRFARAIWQKNQELALLSHKKQQHVVS
ncbi:MAG: translation initiation factor 2 [Clostridia bacterium]|nr:translation initiation factor 2 [Clostridia bacterium]